MYDAIIDIIDIELLCSLLANAGWIEKIQTFDLGSNLQILI